MNRIRHIHFVGIGGSGMNGIAEVLLKKGYLVSGSDIKTSTTIDYLKSLGVEVFLGHKSCNVKKADMIVVSSAISEDNPEVKEAKKRRLPIFKRAQMLGELMLLDYGIAISGTHGKTTTTSLISSLLIEGKCDPTFVIGGVLNNTGSARLGSNFFVAEADESDASFLYLRPKIIVVTNIDRDHMQTYNHDDNCLKNAFLDFLHRLPFYGLAVVCIDDPVVKEILPNVSRPVLTYGFDEESDIKARNFKQSGTRCSFSLEIEGNENMDVVLNLSGKHNVLNALASIAVAKECGVGNDVILRELAKFSGVQRRFQVHGEFVINNKKIILVDDYGHHPNEIKATLDAVRLAWSDRKIVMVFQPHRYSRVRDLFDDFVEVLSQVDKLILLEIYSAGEKSIPSIDSQKLKDAIKFSKNLSPIFLENSDDLLNSLEKNLEDDSVLLLQGAGDIGNIASKLVEKLKI